MIKSNLLGKEVAKATGAAFLRAALSHYLPLYLRCKFRGRPERTPETVRQAYEEHRAECFRYFKDSRPDLDAYVFGSETEKDFCLIDDRIVYDVISRPNRSITETIESYLGPYLRRPGAFVVEFGSGDGRNLLWLKKRFPNVNFLGLELSPTSVDLSRAAAEFYGLNVDFLEANVCEPLPELPQPVSVCFSVFALEQMPRLYARAADNMLGLAQDAVLFFEPVEELFPVSLRGVISRMRVFCMDRLRGLKKYLERKEQNLVTAQRLRTAGNPLNEGCVLEVVKSNGAVLVRQDDGGL